MKYICFVLFVNAFFAACNNSDAVTGNPKYDSLAMVAAKDSANYTTLEWLDPVDQNLGKINQGASIDLMWKFKNTGMKPLLIESARGTCGCTVVEQPQEPIAPGKEGTIKARFNSEGREGTQNKEVIVMANNSNKNGNGQNELKFTVEVLKK